MAKIEIYTALLCPFCTRAVRLLNSKNLSFEQIDVTADYDLRQKMTKRAEGRTSVPQIFIDDLPIGGCDELHALERSGQLDALLGGVKG